MFGGYNHTMNPDADVVRAEVEHLWEDETERHSVELEDLTHREVMLVVMGLEQQAVRLHFSDHHDEEREAMDLRDEVLSQVPDLKERVESVNERAEASGEFDGPTHRPWVNRTVTGAILALLWASGVAVGAGLL